MKTKSFVLLGVSTIILTMGCSQKSEGIKEREDITVKQERLETKLVFLQDNFKILANQLLEEQLKGKYLEAETGVLDKQVLEIIKMLDEYTTLGPKIVDASRVDVSLSWKFIAARDELVKERLKEIVKRRDEYRKDVKLIWKKYEEDKRKALEGN